MAVGLLEAFALIEEYGRDILTVDEILFAAEAKRRKGCHSIKSTLVAAERNKVIELGKRIKEARNTR
jgi:hypothetical protein